MAEKPTSIDASRATNRRGQAVNMAGYWRSNLRLITVLLLIWFTVSYLPVPFVEQLNRIVIAGFPLGYYIGAQGALIVYVLLIFFYAWRMNKLDREYGLDDD